MEVRPALPVDLRQCAALDHQYSTTRVWQIDRRDENGAVTIAFHPVRLPRPMRVRYPRDANRLWEDWRQWDAFFVAEEDGYIRGYAGLLMHAAEGRAWIRDLVVGRQFRRKRFGSKLLQEAKKWATEQNLNRITVEMQSKNYPMITLGKKHGFVFCGFNEFHYPNQDIALFFTLRL